jgi:hypothetical protein
MEDENIINLKIEDENIAKFEDPRYITVNC